MKIETLGHFVDGREVHLYTMKNKNGVQASFTDLGGVWLSLLFPNRSGKPLDLLLSVGDWQDIMENPGHMGEIVGRNSNRIAGGKFQINGKEYRLFLNDGQTSNCHSGPDYYGRRLFQLKDYSENTVTFVLFSKDMDQGFPGDLDFTVSYTLTEENEVQIRYRGRANKDTIMNFTNHAYFNLMGHAYGSLSEHSLTLYADYYTPSDRHLIPSGEIRSVAGTIFDFRSERPMLTGRDLKKDELKETGGFDHNFCIRDYDGTKRIAARAYCKNSGILMEVETDCPGVQFYTANFLSADGLGKEGISYGAHSGFCLETQFYPDAVHHPNFPSTIIRAGVAYHSETTYRFLRRLI